jgi:hypothetical protein
MAKVKAELTAEQKINAFRRIVERGQYETVGGQKVDLFSASVIVKVHDALNEEHRAKLLSLPVNKIAILCYKLIK